MQDFVRVFYESSNGDRWALVRREGGRFPYVLHVANEPSGGTRTQSEVGAFLRRGSWSAENQALLELIGTLVLDPSAEGVLGEV